LYVAYIRLDRFHHVNRWLGYSAGDRVLRECAARLAAVGAATEGKEVPVAGRMGGDEFAYMARLGPEESPWERSQSILQELRRPFHAGAQSVQITASVGFMAALDGDADAREVLRAGSDAAAKSRRCGGNSVHEAVPLLAEEVDIRYELIHDLREAVRRSELLLRFQPQVDRACNLDGFEVLVAWRHPRLGLIEADTFIGLAEDSGIIAELGEWVLRQTCLQMAVWQQSGFDCPKVAVNVSPIQFSSHDFVDRVLAILQETGVPGHALEFEITERAVLQDIEVSAGRMRALREHGITFAIDDFGVGYSPLTYLHRLPVDTVKVDRSFTVEIARNGGSLPLVHTIAVLAHQRGLKVVAEGVETEAELKMVRAARCDRMQGYLFGCPQPAIEVEPLLTNRSSLGPRPESPLEERLY
jgi:diguanylate cyclase (GGDEF)-like protein